MIVNDSLVNLTGLACQETSFRGSIGASRMVHPDDPANPLHAHGIGKEKVEIDCPLTIDPVSETAGARSSRDDRHMFPTSTARIEAAVSDRVEHHRRHHEEESD
jgi:hypothetical protein